MRALVCGVILLSGCSGGQTILSRKPRALDTAATAVAPAPVDTGTRIVSPRFTVDSAVTWPRLQAIVREHQDSILAVQQTRARQVRVAMRNGMRFHATEPQLDAILTLLREVDPAGRILIATE